MSDNRINDTWLLKFQPKDDELLSSWLIRLINAHGALVHPVCRKLWPGISIWTKDIDLQPDSKIIDKLMLKTGYDKSLISKTILDDFNGKFINQLNQSTNNWVLPLGLYQRVKERKALQFCPVCLKEDVRPYFRKIWRLSCYSICLKHNKQLLDCCPQCKKNIAPYNMRWNQFGIPFCNHCNQNLVEIDDLTNVTSEFVIKFHETLEQIRVDGYTTLNGTKISGVEFMYGLRIFMSALTSKKYNRKLLKLGASKSSIPQNKIKFIDQKNYQFEYLDIQDRVLLIEILSNLIFIPTEQLVMSMREKRIGSSCFSGTEYQNIPRWLNTLIEEVKIN